MAVKADFDAVYAESQPFAYYRAYSPTRLSIVEYLAALVQASRRAGLAAGPVIDVGCGYGTLGALLRTDFTMEQVYELYTAGNAITVNPVTGHAPVVVGVDQSYRAILSAEAEGLIDRSLRVDLNEEPELLTNLCAEDGIVVCCAVLGYVRPEALLVALDALRPRLAFVTCVTWLAAEFCDMFAASSLSFTQVSRRPLFQRWATPGEEVEMPAALMQGAHRANCYVLSNGSVPMSMLVKCVEDLRAIRATNAWLAAGRSSAELSA
jgi:SAM-dependent methyltransferase